MSDEKAKVLRPKGIAHVGIQTPDVKKTRDWYCALLNARVVYEKDNFFCTLTFDDEHHRIAIIGLPEMPGMPRRKYIANPEIVHVAFEMEDFETFLLNWERLRDLGILPVDNVNHGATLSSYYLDPHGNQCELFVDCFPTKKECQEWFYSAAYQHNFGGGISFNPEEHIAKLRAGTPAKYLLQYPLEAGMAVDVSKLAEGYLAHLASEVESFKKEISEES